MLRAALRLIADQTMNTKERVVFCSSYSNPFDRLQVYMQVDLVQGNEAPFHPTVEEMKKSENLFVPTQHHKIVFLGAAIDLKGFPTHDLPEVCFIGRSNVGKSSLLRAILNKAHDLKIRVSKSPGHTRSVNFYGIGSLLAIIDMPGYGFRQPKHFADSVEAYLTSRKNLKRTFLLVDGEVGFTSWDQVAVEMVEAFKIPYGLVFTKIDKCKDSKLIRNVMAMQEIRDDKMSTFCFPQLFLTSSSTLEGIAHLQSFIAYTTGNLNT